MQRVIIYCKGPVPPYFHPYVFCDSFKVAGHAIVKGWRGEMSDAGMTIYNAFSKYVEQGRRYDYCKTDGWLACAEDDAVARIETCD